MRILILEDETLVALDLADQLEDAGHSVVGPASSIDHALDLIDANGIDCAVIDANIRGVAPSAVVERLAATGTPFVYLSGYAPGSLDDALPAGEHMSKPADVAALLRRLGELSG